MAFTVPKTQSGGGAGPLTVSYTPNGGGHSLVVLFIASNGNGSSMSTPSASDTVNGAWTKDFQHQNTATVFDGAALHIDNIGSGATTITFNWGTTGNPDANWDFMIFEVGGTGGGKLVFDQSAWAQNGGSANPSVGPTGTLAAAVEFAAAGLGGSHAISGTPGGGWTSVGGANNQINDIFDWQSTTTTTALSATSWTMASGSWGAMIVTYQLQATPDIRSTFEFWSQIPSLQQGQKNSSEQSNKAIIQGTGIFNPRTPPRASGKEPIPWQFWHDTAVLRYGENNRQLDVAVSMLEDLDRNYGDSSSQEGFRQTWQFWKDAAVQRYTENNRQLDVALSILEDLDRTYGDQPSHEGFRPYWQFWNDMARSRATEGDRQLEAAQALIEDLTRHYGDNPAAEGFRQTWQFWNDFVVNRYRENLPQQTIAVSLFAYLNRNYGDHVLDAGSRMDWQFWTNVSQSTNYIVNSQQTIQALIQATSILTTYPPKLAVILQDYPQAWQFWNDIAVQRKGENDRQVEAAISLLNNLLRHYGDNPSAEGFRQTWQLWVDILVSYRAASNDLANRVQSGVESTNILTPLVPPPASNNDPRPWNFWSEVPVSYRDQVSKVIQSLTSMIDSTGAFTPIVPPQSKEQSFPWKFWNEQPVTARDQSEKQKSSMASLTKSTGILQPRVPPYSIEGNNAAWRFWEMGQTFKNYEDVRVVKPASYFSRINTALGAVGVIHVVTLVANTVTSTASITKQVSKTLTANVVSSTASLLKNVGKNLVATSSSTANMARNVGKTLLAASSSTASLAKNVSKTLIATSSSAASIMKGVLKTLVANPVTSTAFLTFSRIYFVLLQATSTASASVSKQVGKMLQTTSSATASIGKAISIVLKAVSTSTAYLTTTIIEIIRLILTMVLSLYSLVTAPLSGSEPVTAVVTPSEVETPITVDDAETVTAPLNNTIQLTMILSEPED